MEIWTLRLDIVQYSLRRKPLSNENNNKTYSQCYGVVFNRMEKFGKRLPRITALTILLAGNPRLKKLRWSQGPHINGGQSPEQVRAPGRGDHSLLPKKSHAASRKNTFWNSFKEETIDDGVLQNQIARAGSGANRPQWYLTVKLSSYKTLA